MIVKEVITNYNQPGLSDLYYNVYSYQVHQLLLALEEVGVASTVSVAETASNGKIYKVSASVSFGGASPVTISNVKDYSYINFYDVNGEGFENTTSNQRTNASRFSVTNGYNWYIKIYKGDTSCIVFISSSPINLTSDVALLISKTEINGVVETCVNGLHSQVNNLGAKITDTYVIRQTYVDLPSRAITSNTKRLIKSIDILGITSTGYSSLELNGSVISELFGTVKNDVHWILVPPAGTPITPYSVIVIDGVGYIVRGKTSYESYHLWKVG